jgi:hypothetical protein
MWTSEQITIYTQASRIRSALEYLPHKDEEKLYQLWEYGISQELVGL